MLDIKRRDICRKDNKWYVDNNIPIFTQNRLFIVNIVEINDDN